MRLWPKGTGRVRRRRRAKKESDPSDRAVTQSQDDLHEIPRDLQIYIFAFLSAKDLSNSMQVNPFYYNLSNAANTINLKKQNPNFVLEENCMNIVLSNFLQKHFEK